MTEFNSWCFMFLLFLLHLRWKEASRKLHPSMLLLMVLFKKKKKPKTRNLRLRLCFGHSTTLPPSTPCFSLCIFILLRLNFLPFFPIKSVTVTELKTSGGKHENVTPHAKLLIRSFCRNFCDSSAAYTTFSLLYDNVIWTWTVITKESAVVSCLKIELLEIFVDWIWHVISWN